MARRPIEFSVVIPAHNEEGALEGAVAAVERVLRGVSHEVIIAEDGSRDRTVEVAGRLCRKFRNVRLLSSPARLGRGKALCRAFAAARGKLVAYMDADLATEPARLLDLLDSLRNGADVVTGSRYVKGAICERGVLRHFLSKAYNFLVRALLGSGLCDHQCGFKGFRRAVAIRLCALAEDNHWFWDTECLVIAQKNGLAVGEIPVEWREPEGRKSKVNAFGDARDMLGRIFRLRGRLAKRRA
ncbi:glycosyltransferase [Candidatus Micrarchaeota archaeon]|nr:glycosyltransferase [Candidatus Micrarchaeota archaeon]MBI5176587.1 glycosyltransferase [Candidatus Micrarchaeota archaeon]